MFGLAEILFFLIFIGGVVVWIWALVDAIKVPSDDLYRSGNKLVWVIVIAFLQLIGAIIYFAIGRPTSSARGFPPPLPPPPPPPR